MLVMFFSFCYSPPSTHPKVTMTDTGIQTDINGTPHMTGPGIVQTVVVPDIITRIHILRGLKKEWIKVCYYCGDTNVFVS